MSEKLDQIKEELIKFYMEPNSLKATARHFNLPITTCRRYLKQLSIIFHSKEITDQLQKQNIKRVDKKEKFQRLVYKDAANFYLQDHSLLETSKKFKLDRDELRKAFIFLNIPLHSKEKTFKIKVQRAKENNFKKYGVENYVETETFKEKSKQTCLEKYGVTSYTKTKECQEKIASTCNEKYGESNFAKTELYLQKSHDTKKLNHSFNSSKPEEMFYDELCKIFDKEDIYRQYKEIRYPFDCDFYIKSLDLFIELNLTWTHGYHLFNKEDAKDQNTLKIWEEKANRSTYYKNAIRIWTKTDPFKLKIAKENNLNYLTIYKINDLQVIIERLKEEYLCQNYQKN